MTKNNEPQDELREALADLGSDKSLADGGELQAPLGQPDAGSSDNWAENKGTESVEEAFLALIQSNKAEEGINEEVPPQVTVPGADIFGQPEEQPAIFSPDQSPLEENLSGNLHSNPFAQPPENVSPQNPFGNEPQVTSPEPAFTDHSIDETAVASEVDERSLTEALSETIAQSLAEIHTSETIEEELVAQSVQNDPIMQSVAMQSEPLVQEPVVPHMQSQPQPQTMQPEMLFQEPQPVQPTQQVQVPPQTPVQPQLQSQQPALPEFTGSNHQGSNHQGVNPQSVSPLDNYPLETQEQQPPVQQVQPVEDLIADMAAVTSSEIKIDSNSNNNDVMNQHHAYSNPFEAQKPQPAQVPPQVPVTHMGGSAGEGSQAAKMSAPVPVELAGTGGNNKSNADPEFQALVQWSNSDVEPSHHGPHDMPNFLSQKREEESKFSIKTVFLSIGISVIVIGMFYVGYQAGSGGQEPDERVVDVTPRAEEPVQNRRTAEATQMFENNRSSLAGRPAAPVKPEATITVFKVASLKGQAGRTIPMNIRLEGTNLGQETMLLLRGIPNQISLTTGIKREGVWSVPISELRKLALNVPSNYKGNFDFEVFAFKDKESGPEHRLASVRIDAMPKPVIRREPVRKPIQIEEEPVRKIPPAVKKQEPRPQPPVVNVRPKPKAPLINPAVEAAMLKRANSLLQNGDVAGARLVFEHVAVMGSKHAAYALARTYERSYLEKLNIIGVVDDINLARKWYKKAADLGHSDAAARLQQIGFAQ